MTQHHDRGVGWEAAGGRREACKEEGRGATRGDGYAACFRILSLSLSLSLSVHVYDVFIHVLLDVAHVHKKLEPVPSWSGRTRLSE